MQTQNAKKSAVQATVIGAIMTALVIVLQLFATFTTFFGPFSTAVALIPIVIGTALCGVGMGAWLGFVFGVVVLLSGNAALFLAYSIPGTIVTVLVKGTVCGLVAGLAYKALVKFNRLVAVIAASILCPVTNTAVFLLGCRIFFMQYANTIADNLSLGVSGMVVFWALAMGNFVFELGMNVVLSPTVVRLLSIAKKTV